MKEPAEPAFWVMSQSSPHLGLAWLAQAPPALPSPIWVTEQHQVQGQLGNLSGWGHKTDLECHWKS